MRTLVLGGTVFVGRHIVDAALAAGHTVTAFNRGVTAAAAPGVESLIGNRDDDLSALAGRSFDAVVDCSGYTPAQLTASAAALAGRVGHYLYVSSRSVYRSLGPQARNDPSSPLLEGNEGYGALKARGEEAIAAALPGRVTIVRPGLIVGPFDPTGRFTYWPLRAHRGGDLLVPGRPERQVQCIDARDLASWCVALVAQAPGRTYDAVGTTMTMAAFVDALVATVAADVPIQPRWIDDEALVAAGVAFWTELPLWIPEAEPDFGGLMLGRDKQAIAAGLVKRPIETTIRDTLAWALRPDARTPRAVATMTTAREAELLAAHTSRAPPSTAP